MIIRNASTKELYSFFSLSREQIREVGPGAGSVPGMLVAGECGQRGG